ncbi:molecular chaperone TorD family protein [Halodesulfurarchaeum sp. HSR-GB]|uniref:TorD/DmsD family molecular chaperone n=1 Tax=Halodesulfurarchaeum sp. HSR-GB TaxID=3074077 RepID=UPI002865550B|nr:molecular chaperone TorD family protein [Halodesulfurarchaeum sp. HSR-GB]MDR5656701.1 molecular chaperone TorD family protein [Halodesulfurarchaeum sp. HSR-GB]
MSEATVATEFARARADLYDLLSRAFDGDTEALAEALETGVFGDFAAVLPGAPDTAALTRTDLDQDALQVGYDNLFVVPGPYYVPPFASGHATEPSEAYDSDAAYHEVGTAGELFGDPAESVATLYDRANFTPERGEGIPDHVAAEFEFMARLAARQATGDPQASEELLAVQGEMIEHLAWLADFSEAVGSVDDAEGVYAAVCSFANAFVAWDREQFDATEY